MIIDIKNLPIKKKFFLIMTLFILFGIIADIGLIEISKTADLQRLARDHLVYLNTSLLRIQDLAKIDDPDNNSIKVFDILDNESDFLLEMGIVQTLGNIKIIAESIADFANPLEKYLFKMAGFGEIFKIVNNHDDDIITMEKTVDNYKNDTISYEQLVTELDLTAELLREDEDSLSKIINSLSHFVSKLIIITINAGLIIIIIMGLFIYKKMLIPLNEARNNIHTSSQELQANSKQQLQAASNQTTAVSEINSVMQELVATSNQISEISANANLLSKDTDSAVKEGHISLSQALEGINTIKEKVGVSATNMISLGEKSQQIGIVLDVINELSQQVTVLSYNATIEAAGAGEMGKRFMAVADRIIKLAERSVESAKEVNSIVDDIQTDSNKTIMSTEDGMKAVDEGIAYSMKVKESLDRINDFTKQVMSSVDEISISLNQQKTGIEQAATEVEEISILVRETEDGSRQVEATAGQLLEMAGMLEKI